MLQINCVYLPVISHVSFQSWLVTSWWRTHWLHAGALILHFAPFTSETRQQRQSCDSRGNFSNYCCNYNHARATAVPLAFAVPLVAGWAHRGKMLISIPAFINLLVTWVQQKSLFTAFMAGCNQKQQPSPRGKGKCSATIRAAAPQHGEAFGI